MAIRVKDDESGQVLVVMILCMAILLAFMALAVDVGQILYAKRQLQTAADAAALAAALQGNQCGKGNPNCTAMQIAATTAITENGMPTPTLLTQCTGNVDPALTLQLNNAPCALGANDPNFGNAKYVEAIVFKQQRTFFGIFAGVRQINLSARSEAALGPSPYCVNVLDPSTSAALGMNGNSNLDATCGVMVNSSSNSALQVNGNADLSATRIDVHGNAQIQGNPTVSPTPTGNFPVQPDPFAGTPKPTPGTPVFSNITIDKKTPQTLTPGTYYGDLNLNAQTDVTLSPGVYIMANGSLNINGQATLRGTGVMIYILSGQFHANAQATIDLSAQTTGPYAGILFFQDPNDHNDFIVNGGAGCKWEGAIYLPGADLRLNGGSNVAAYTFIVAKTITVNGNNTFTINHDYSSLPGGSPAAGNTAFLME